MTIFALILAPLLALIPPAAGPASSGSPAPSPSPTPRALKTIVTVVSSPYCNALADHFNSALVPMIANDRTFDAVGVQLDQMNDMFDYPDYVNRFLKLRGQIVKESDTLIASLKPIQQQVDRLMDSAALSTDPQAQQQMRDAAMQLRIAYQHQFQLSSDMQRLAQDMMQYDVLAHRHPLGGWTPAQNSMPQEALDIKTYYHFKQQRQTIDGAEDKAVDLGYSIAEQHCTKP